MRKPLTIHNTSEEPLSIHPATHHFIVNQELQESANEEVKSMKEEFKLVKERLDELTREVTFLRNSTLPTIAINVRVLLDAILYQMGRDPNQTRAQFIRSNTASIAKELTIPEQAVNIFHGVRFVPFWSTSFLTPFFHRRYVNDDDHADHVATSMGIADAISQLHISLEDRRVWNELFERYFRVSVKEVVTGTSSAGFLVDGRYLALGGLHGWELR
jgi:hypothetical protein